MDSVFIRVLRLVRRAHVQRRQPGGHRRWLLLTVRRLRMEVREQILNPNQVSRSKVFLFLVLMQLIGSFSVQRCDSANIMLDYTSYDDITFCVPVHVYLSDVLNLITYGIKSF